MMNLWIQTKNVAYLVSISYVNIVRVCVHERLIMKAHLALQTQTSGTSLVRILRRHFLCSSNECMDTCLSETQRENFSRIRDGKRSLELLLGNYNRLRRDRIAPVGR